MLALVPPRTQSEPGSPARQHIQRSNGLNQHAGVAIRYPRDHHAQPDTRGLPGHKRQRSVGLKHGVFYSPQLGRLEEVVHHPQTIEACFLGAPAYRSQRRAKASGRTRPREIYELEAELHSLLAGLSTAAARVALICTRFSRCSNSTRSTVFEARVCAISVYSIAAT